MKLLAFALLVLSGCAGPDVRKPPCDPVANRDDVFVCGDRAVMKTCRPVSGRPEFVCDHL